MIDLFQEIYASIKKNKLRTFLTGFAVAWGIFILIVLLGAGNGLLNAFEKNIQRFNTSSISIRGGRTSEAFQGYQRDRRITFKEADIQTLIDKLGEHLENGGGEISIQNNVSTSKDFILSRIAGVYPSYQITEALEIIQGRFINEIDTKENRKSIVIHEEAVPILFDTKDPLGQIVTLDSLSYQVVGVYKGGGFRDNSNVYVPLQTLKLIYNKDELSNCSFILNKNIQSEKDNEILEEKLRSVLAQEHHFNPQDKRAVWIWNRLSNFLQQQNASKYLSIAIWVIGIFTLLSGVVGVSNIMLITVKERTKEFGIRKAIGAKPSSILKLVLTESIVITTFFGYFGMLAGIGATEWMNHVAGTKVMDAGAFSQTVFLNPTVDISIAIQATLTLIIAGTIAGYVPARRAVKIKPVDALNAR
ncbi:ABC transporter permease [Bacteroides coprosuis]|uniref:ABC transporter permease n=1 Tax=Bacteroides coprosuis TaxID=151276 RepID=UPI001D3F77EC|nr:ABC transporter permease [Bacteroides coprosuis]HJD92584.1 ABC transporter permease [Bacteroides coprosuis]